MRLYVPALLAPLFLTLAACGGGGGGSGSSSSSSSSSGGTTPPPPVVLNFFADSAYIGSGQSPTLRWNSTGTECVATGGWSGSKRVVDSQVVGPITETTTFTLTCSAANASPTSVSLTVVASTSLPPAPTANKVWSDENVSSLDFVRIPYGIVGAVWSESRGLLYGITSPESPTAPNSLVSLDPVTRAAQVLPLGAEAWTIEISVNNEFLYIGLRQGAGVRRVRTVDFTQDLAVSIGGPGTNIQRVVPSPTSPHTFAVLADRVLGENDAHGLFIYDDATLRPSFMAGLGIAFIDADWNADGTLIYAVGGASNYGMHYVDIDAQGAHPQRLREWPMASPGTVVGDRFFSWDGRVYGLNGPVNLLSRIPCYDFASCDGPYVVPSRGKIFTSGTHLDGSFADGTRIVALDFEKQTYLDSIVFNGAASFNESGKGGVIVPWGTDGMLITGWEESAIARGTFAAAGNVPAQSSATLPLVASGVTRSADAGAISYRVVDMRAMAVTSNPCGKLFVSTDMMSWVRPGSVLEVNPSDLTITRSAQAGSEPYLLAASDDCSTLYAAPQFSSSVLRLRTSDLATTDVLPIGGEDLSRVRSMSVAPGQAQTVAVSLGDVDRTLCAGTDQGVVIFDGATPRPVYRPDGQFSIKSITFGANAGVLYGEDHNSVFAFTANASGLGNPRVVMPNPEVSLSYDLGPDLYFDPAANRVYNLFGNVFDAATNVEMPRISLAYTPSVTSCGSAAQTRVTDANSGKLFWVSGGAAQYSLGLSAYARNGLAKLWTVDFGPGLEFGQLGNPLYLTRLPGNRLAFVTWRGYLILVEGAALAP